jgi:Kef-type K+ transport system membrane component KefB
MFSFVTPIDEIDLFISIGVFFLFFIIGLEEIDLPGLFRVLRKRIFAASAIGFLVPFVVAGVFGLSLDMNFAKSFAIASVIGASSLGVTAKILTDIGKLRSTIGLEIFTVTAIVEFIAIIVTSVMIQINSEQSPMITDFVWLFVKMIIFFAIAGILAVFGLPQFFRIIKKHVRLKQVYFGVTIGMILMVAYFAEISGIHGAIGALLLGIAVSRMAREEYTEISKSVHAIGYGIFIPIFFAGIGLHFVPSFLELPIWIIVGFLSIIVGVKFLGSYLAVYVVKMRPTTTVAFGVMSKGAVDLALMLSLLEAKLLENTLFSLLVFGTLITMIVSSVGLQTNLKKVVQVKVGKNELALLPLFLRRTVSDYVAKQVMITDYKKINSDLTLDEFKELKSSELKKHDFLVTDLEDNLLGAISNREIKKVDKKSHGVVRIHDIMYSKLHTVLPDEYLFSVIQKMNSHPFDMIPVVENINSNKVIGLVTAENIMSLFTEKKPESKQNNKNQTK